MRSQSISAVSILQRDLARGQPFVNLRFLPGLFRVFSLLEREGYSYDAFLSPEEALRLGLSAGWGGKFGWPRLVRSLRDAQNSRGQLGPVTVRSFADTAIFAGAKAAGASRAKSTHLNFLRSLGVQINSGRATEWKDALLTGQLASLRDVLRGKELFFIGAPRTLDFARSIGVPLENFLSTPDYDSFLVSHELKNRLRIRLSQTNGRPGVVLQSISIAGHVILCDLALEGFEFFGVDLGIVSALFDTEYLASRPFFTYAPRKFFSLQQELRRPARKQHLVDCSKPEQKAARRLTKWPEIEDLATDDTTAAIRALRQVLNHLEQNVRAPVLESTLLLWEFFFKSTVDAELLGRCEAELVRLEPLLAAAVVHDLLGHKTRARSLIQQASVVCDLDPRLEEWRTQVRNGVGDETAHRVEWIRLLTLSTRPVLGSALNWTLRGDIRG